MSSKGNLLHVPMTQSGFNFSRNFELVPDTALILPSTNYNIHNLGVEKRGGTSISLSGSNAYKVMGGYDFRKSTGSQSMIYAKNNGNVYADNDSTPIASGMSTANFFHFSQYYDDLYFTDGASIPKKFSGGSAVNVIPATDFTTDPPFQIIFHPRGASFRNWAISKNGVYASADGTGNDFSDANVKFIPVYSRGGLVAAFEFGQELFVLSKTEAFRIDDSDPSPVNWGYQKAIWEGGAAHWRLVCLADNDVHIMADDLNIYSLRGVFQTGDYRKASISRPAQIDRYLRENSTYTNIENWHCSFDPKLRCIKWFIQVGGSSNNTALVQFIDREPDKMWAIHDNLEYNSGYKASCSFSYRKSTSDWRIRTGDASGNIWQLEELSRSDNGNAITSILKWKPWEFNNPLMHKFFAKGILRLRSTTNIMVKIYIWINNIRIPDIEFDITSSGAVFDSSAFDSAYFSDDTISKSVFDIKSFGETLQMQIIHNGLNEDFFLAEVIAPFKENGLRLYEN